MQVTKPKAFFVTGTDTEVGKSRVAASLLAAARQAGLSTAALKPVASGCVEIDGQLRNEDALLLSQYCSLPLSYDQINPVALRLAIAPHLAAANDGRRLQLDRLVGFARGMLMQRADVTIMEGAGGWRVPLNSHEFLSGLPAALNMPVILVVGLKLGCINHALLTAEAVRRDGLPLAGWVANHLSADMPAAADNLATLRAALPAPCLGELPWAPADTPDDCGRQLDLAQLLTTDT
ncbi:MAG: dethiobiotin synthase [Gammaproteobacteria bacterium]|nr:dethiobiotin synthase [Gammaproteobacteria bacterium]|tara:strand:- start:3664 stop:4368 length:705 start_codon:yes stop_codon:yes gene_type:complete